LLAAAAASAAPALARHRDDYSYERGYRPYSYDYGYQAPRSDNHDCRDWQRRDMRYGRNRWFRGNGYVEDTEATRDTAVHSDYYRYCR